MKKTPFKVSIGRYTSNCGPDGVRFHIESISGGLMMEFDMDLKTFAECITGLGHCETKVGEIYGEIDRVHKVRIFKHFRVLGDFNLNYKTRNEDAYQILLKDPEVQKLLADGWELSKSFSSQGDIDGKGIKANFHKWVPVNEIPEEHRTNQYEWVRDWHKTLIECMEEAK